MPLSGPFACKCFACDTRQAVYGPKNRALIRSITTVASCVLIPTSMGGLHSFPDSSAMPNDPTLESGKRIRALLLADRIDTSNLEHDGVVSTAPLTFKCGQTGLVTLLAMASPSSSASRLRRRKTYSVV